MSTKCDAARKRRDAAQKLAKWTITAMGTVRSATGELDCPQSAWQPTQGAHRSRQRQQSSCAMLLGRQSDAAGKSVTPADTVPCMWCCTLLGASRTGPGTFLNISAMLRSFHTSARGCRARCACFCPKCTGLTVQSAVIRGWEHRLCEVVVHLQVLPRHSSPIFFCSGNLLLCCEV